MTVEKMTILGHFSEWSFKNWPFLAKGGVLEQKVMKQAGTALGSQPRLDLVLFD